MSDTAKPERSEWKELPRPATPGPWETAPYTFRDDWGVEHEGVWRLVHVPDGLSKRPFGPEDAAAIAALPEYVAEVERLRAWADWFFSQGIWEEGGFFVTTHVLNDIRAGEWPPKEGE